MKYIISQLKTFWKLDFNFPVYLTTLILLTVAIWYNYTVDFEDSILDSYFGQHISLLYYFLYYSVGYGIVLIIYFLFDIQRSAITNRQFILASSFMIFGFAFSNYFYFHKSWIADTIQYVDRYTYSKILNAAVNIFIYGIAIWGFSKWFADNESNLLGMTWKGFKWRPYALMLIIVLPLIALAATSPEFLKSYPRLKMHVFKEGYWSYFFQYEPFYLLNFVFLEWFFRGVLVIGMVKFLGHRAVLPMVVLYCFIHFGKPLGECVSSIFGGYILGVFAYYSKSIWGGIILHMGLALMMDLAAIIARFI